MTLNDYANVCHQANMKWWQNIDTGQPIKRNKGELIALMHSEVSECFEGESLRLMDDKLPHRPMGEVELVDAQIRIFDFSAGFGYDLNPAGELVGLSEFLDLNHLAECVMEADHQLHGEQLITHGTDYIHALLSKLLEAERKARTQEVPGRIVDCLVAISIYGSKYDLQGAFTEKMAYNATRQDHTHEARRIAGGKQF